VSIRPLRVEELAEILAIQFDEGALPEYDTDWRPENSEEDVLSVCSSLISVVDVDGSRVVQFSHFSVQEYLSSKRLADVGPHLSQYHILPHSAHTIIAQASLSVLLALDDKVDKDMMKNFPLATYAARYWVDHAQFENVSSSIKDGMARLFDAAKPHFATWVWMYDIDDPFREMMFAARPTPPEAVPLYYATLCRLRDLVEHLINTFPRDINARGGYHCTPLHVATVKGDIDVMKLLLAHGADVTSLGNREQTPLHETSERGHFEMTKLLLGRDVDVNAQDEDGTTALYLASCEGELEVVRALLQHGASVDCRSIEGWTPLQTASEIGHLGVVQLLFESGAAVDSQNNAGWTPLILASQNGHLGVVDFLLQNGAAVDFRHSDGRTPLFQASVYGHLDVVKLLLQSGAAVDGKANNGWTPLHKASENGCLDVVRLLLQSGATVDGKTNVGWTSLDVASWRGRLDVVRFLIQNGATVNSHDNHSSTPSSGVSRCINPSPVRSLMSAARFKS
jgi:ankyrin repeat protein